VVRRP